MKKLFALTIVILLAQNVVLAQNGKSVSEKDVPERYVKDFNRQVQNVKSVKWEMIDSLVYDACYTNDNGTRTVYRFSPKGTETRWYIEEKYYPHAIMQTIEEMHPGHKVKELYCLLIKNKVTYQVLVGKRKGFFTKRWKNMRYMNFEADYKFIDEIEL
ncbi:MAG: hypothetical protein IKN84_05670 [Bacteroidales bacterium]|jgi:hypothetical protein|nr:hypothetical protein [Bacteroidales bacterium]